MLKFKHKVTGNIVPATEEHANQVLRPQGHYEEVFEEEAPIKVETPVSKKKAKKKTTKGNK